MVANTRYARGYDVFKTKSTVARRGICCAFRHAVFDKVVFDRAVFDHAVFDHVIFDP